MSDAPEQHPFHRWVEAGRPREQIWRTVLGVVIAVAIYMLWTFVVLLAATGLGLIDRDAVAVLIGQSDASFTYSQSVVMMLIILSTFWGLWFGVWAALRLLHKRGVRSVIAHGRRFSLKQFWIGGAIAAGYLLINLGVSLTQGVTPHRTDVDVGAWLMFLAPLAVFIFLQAAGEELLFRGYIPQQLAAHGRPVFVWGFLPAFGFGLMHAANGGTNPSYVMFYVVAATISGLIFMAMVWRTGSLAAAMGFHFVNNVAGFLFIGLDSGGSSLALYGWTQGDAMLTVNMDLLVLGLTLAFVLSPLCPLPKGQPVARRNETRAAP